MHILEKISEFVGNWMAVVVLVIAALSLFVPKSTLWIELSWVNYLLMIVMFGMGLTLKLSSFDWFYRIRRRNSPQPARLRLRTGLSVD